MTAPVIMYASPFCGYCTAAKALLVARGIEYTEIDVLAEPERRSEMITRSGRTTVPQIFIGTAHVGGYEDLESLDASGKLGDLLAAHSPQD